MKATVKRAKSSPDHSYKSEGMIFPGQIRTTLVIPSLARKAVEPASQGMTDEAAKLLRKQQYTLQSHPLTTVTNVRV